MAFTEEGTADYMARNLGGKVFEVMLIDLQDAEAVAAKYKTT